MPHTGGGRGGGGKQFVYRTNGAIWYGSLLAGAGQYSQGLILNKWDYCFHSLSFMDGYFTSSLSVTIIRPSPFLYALFQGQWSIRYCIENMIVKWFVLTEIELLFWNLLDVDRWFPTATVSSKDLTVLSWLKEDAVMTWSHVLLMGMRVKWEEPGSSGDWVWCLLMAWH